MQYVAFYAVWLLSSLILGTVHGPTLGTFFGLAIATAYVIVVRAPRAMARWQRKREAGQRLPVPATYI